MKRYIAAVLVCAMAFMAGCSAKDDAAQTSSNGNTDTVNAAVNDGAEGEAAQDVKVIYGEIVEVIGNQINIKEIERPQNFNGGQMPEGITPGQGFQMPEGVTPGEGFDPANIPDGQAINRGDGTGRTRGDGTNGGGRVTRNDDGTITITNEDGTTTTINPEDMQNGDMPAGRGTRMERQYTGEQFEVMIPTGVAVTTRAFENGAVVEKEIALEKLTGGDIITITYKPNGKAIDSVVVQQNTGTGGGMFFGGDGAMMIPEGAQGFRIEGAMPDGGTGEAFFYAAPAAP